MRKRMGGGGRGVGGQSEKQWYYSGKTDVPFGQRHSKNILLFNFLIYLFLSRNSPNLLTDLLIAPTGVTF